MVDNEPMTDNEPVATATTTPAPSPPTTTENTTGQPTARPKTQQEHHTLYEVPNYEFARTINSDQYRKHVRELHTKMSGGDSTEYVESKVPLPRSLHGLKTSQVVAKLLSLNPSLDSETWSTVTADVVGANLVVGTVSARGRKMIDELNELKVEPGRAVKVPLATKPNNMYHVELLLPYERELHLDLMEAFLRKFPSAKYISMPGNRPWGTHRRLRLFFNTTTAPREVFTENDPNTPIREIVLPCGTAAQVIHKWQRLNQVRPPHLMNRWFPNAPARSYAAAAATASRTTNPSTDATRATHATGNSTPHTPANGTQPPALVRRPGAVPAGPPGHTQHAYPNGTTERVPHEQEDWSSMAPMDTDAEFDHLPTAPLTSGERTNPQRLTASTAHATAQNTDNIPVQTNTAPTASAPIPNTNPNKSADPRTNPPVRTRNNTRSTAIQPQEPNPPPPPTNLTNQPILPKQAQPHPAPERNTKDPSQWQQVKRARTKEAPPTAGTTQKPTTLRKSGSRNNKQKALNKFAPLEFEIHPTFEDDNIAPITVATPKHLHKPQRRKYKKTHKAWTKDVTEACSHARQVRHPIHALQHLSPAQTQVTLRSNNQVARQLRDRVVRQIALIRAARTNITEHQITLDNHADETFIQQVRDRMAITPDPQPCSEDTAIDVPLSSLLDKDELRVRGAICFSWVDLATRAILPCIYDNWPTPPVWIDKPLTWLPAADEDLPCLSDEALAYLAACPSLQRVWEHVTTDAPELESAIRTAANQWRLYTTSQTTHRI